ncbi:MAG: ShlB/FhaC/HecB family hemolysin secretion/activation protein, partial [Candidatus Omnitrophica bacterium]|nr:ShlB/FhaC/HecB family hemolysin secretion/activation protein [Candidatus Omnitrophota bacterium]
VQDQSTWHRGVTLDNQGSRVLGDIRGGGYIRSSNATGHGDTLYVSTNRNSRSAGEVVSYKTPIDTYGTYVGFTFSHNDMKLGKEFKQYDITGTTNQGSVELTKELALTESFQSRAVAGLNVKSIKKHTLGQVTSDDQLRIPYLGLNLIEKDSTGSTSFSPRLDFGTANFLGASSLNHPSASRAGTGGAFVKFSQDVTRTQSMPWDSYLSLRGEFQATSRTLTSSEQLQLGGEGSIRGYPEGDYLADVGGDGSVEFNCPMYLIPKDWKLPKEEGSLRNQIMPYIFADMGAGTLKKVLPGESASKTLWSAGGGIRIHLYNSIYWNMDWAKALGDKHNSGSGPSTFHFSLQVEV